VSLRDGRGREHPVIVDVGCRNTVFDAASQSAAEHVPGLLARGVRRFRVEFVREGEGEARAVLDAYGALLAGRLGSGEALRRVGASSRLGVSDRPMAVLGRAPSRAR
jgi:putative protease